MQKDDGSTDTIKRTRSASVSGSKSDQEGGEAGVHGIYSHLHPDIGVTVGGVDSVKRDGTIGEEVKRVPSSQSFQLRGAGNTSVRDRLSLFLRTM